MVRTVSEHYVWCSSEGTPPINISLMNSTTTLAFGKGIVWSKLNQGGNYSCVATNEVGTESKTFYVSLIDFRVCVNLCDCRGTTSRRSQFENIFRCTGKYSAHLLNNIPTTTTKLWLENNEITHLPETVFSGLSALQYLSLENNEITHLPENVFSGPRVLYYLFLSNNEITHLPENVFSGLSALQSLLQDAWTAYVRRTETKGERKRTRTTKRYTSNSLKLVEEVTPQILFLDTKSFVISTDELFRVDAYF
ncbi:slit homolog 1 protein-like [Montipora capricornis]|uniref:slit homolog 1 protein-like n=1 Tax=Montipora capricornis TaxID=246305 RepID=UPI0035F18CB3